MMAFGPTHATQRGQALVEAALVLAALMVLLLASLVLGRLHVASIQLSHVSRTAAMAAARGLAVQARVESGNAILHGVADVMPGESPSGSQAMLRDEWLDPAKRVHVRAESRIELPSPLAGLRIMRQAQVLAGAGHASDDAQGQRRVGNAASWRDAARPSLAQARAMAVALEPAEAPWGRSAPSMEWLQAWDDVVPDERLRAADGETP